MIVTRVIKQKGPYQPGSDPVYGETPVKPLVPKRPEETLLPLPLAPIPSRSLGKRRSTAQGLFGSVEDVSSIEPPLLAGCTSGVFPSGHNLSDGLWPMPSIGDEDESVDSRVLMQYASDEPAKSREDLSTYSPFNKELL